MGLGRLTDEAFEAVIFDLDGTLINSTPAVLRSWDTWTNEYGRWNRRPIDRHCIAEIELANLSDVTVLPGAVEALASLAGAKSAIATSCTVPLAEARIAASHLEPPTVLVTADDVVHGKPHPEPFLQAARRLGVNPHHCLVVEDAPSGLEAARAAGCFTLAVITTTPREALHADAIVADLSEVRFETDGEGIQVKLADEAARALRQAQGADLEAQGTT